MGASAHAGAQFELTPWQGGGIVAGLEASANSFGGTGGGAPCPNPSVNCRVQLHNLITLGVAWNNVMFYGSGGWAGGTVGTQCTNCGGVLLATTSVFRNGWYAGGGADLIAIQTGNVTWLVGAEYQHFAMASALHVIPGGATNNRNVSVTGDLVKAKLTLLFGKP